MRGIARLFLGSLVFTLAVLLSCCQQQINSPAPSISKLVPSDIAAGQPTFSMEVDGNNFTPASVVFWNGQELLSLFVTTKELTAQVPAGDIQNAGTATVVVETAPPGGGTTLTLTFTIDSVSSKVPQITSISPPSVSTGSAGLTLDVAGQNFVSLATVTVNGSIRQTSFLGTTLLQAALLSSDVATAGTLEIAVVNPPPGGGSSSSVPLKVRNPVPVITSLTPAAILAGSPGSILGVSGANFVPDSVITLNGSPRTTTFASSAAIQTSLNAGDFLTAGVVQVAVVNPADGGSGGGSSNTTTFAVNATELNGPPLIVDLAPDGTQANTGIAAPLVRVGLSRSRPRDRPRARRGSSSFLPPRPPISSSARLSPPARFFCATPASAARSSREAHPVAYPRRLWSASRPTAPWPTGRVPSPPWIAEARRLPILRPPATW